MGLGAWGLGLGKVFWVHCLHGRLTSSRKVAASRTPQRNCLQEAQAALSSMPHPMPAAHKPSVSTASPQVRSPHEKQSESSGQTAPKKSESCSLTSPPGVLGLVAQAKAQEDDEGLARASSFGSFGRFAKGGAQVSRDFGSLGFRVGVSSEKVCCKYGA